MGKRTEYRAQIEQAYQQLDISDNVSEAEAIIIAQYNLLELGMEDEVDLRTPQITESQLVDGCWSVSFDAKQQMKIKSGLEWFAFDIDKSSGNIKVKGWGPS